MATRRPTHFEDVDRKLERSGIVTVPRAEALALEQTRLLMGGLTRVTSN